MSIVVTGADAGIGRGDLLSHGGSLPALIDRPTTTPADAIRGAFS